MRPASTSLRPATRVNCRASCRPRSARKPRMRMARPSGILESKRDRTRSHRGIDKVFWWHVKVRPHVDRIHFLYEPSRWERTQTPREPHRRGPVHGPLRPAELSRRHRMACLGGPRWAGRFLTAPAWKRRSPPQILEATRTHRWIDTDDRATPDPHLASSTPSLNSGRRYRPHARHAQGSTPSIAQKNAGLSLKRQVPHRAAGGLGPSASC